MFSWKGRGQSAGVPERLKTDVCLVLAVVRSEDWSNQHAAFVLACALGAVTAEEEALGH